MNSKPQAYCLDLSRLVSRAGRGPLTGVDRVERAYLGHLLAGPFPLFALIRMRLGYALLAREGITALVSRLDEASPWGAPDIRARLTPGLTPHQRCIEADLRRFALQTCLRRALPRLLSRHWPQGTCYLNVGHSNLTQRVLKAAAEQTDAKINVLIHDMIPLDLPHYQRPGQPTKFEAAMRLVSRYADKVIYNSAYSKERAESYFAQWNRTPPGVVAHLGIDRLRPAPAEIPDTLPTNRPYFVTLGTIEPRKNHSLLLDVWESLASKAEKPPALFIIGSRGWNNEDIFARLDSSVLIGTDIFELNGLPDGAIAALIQGARAMLFPSHAEGFGLPPAEALALGTPALCNDLPIYREFLKDLPVYLKVSDHYLWEEVIKKMAETDHAETRVKRSAMSLPTWDTHFNLALGIT